MDSLTTATARVRSAFDGNGDPHFASADWLDALDQARAAHPSVPSRAAPAAAPPPAFQGFAAGNRPQPVDRVFADLAAEVYRTGGTGADGWHKLGSQDLNRLGIDPSGFADAKTDFKAALYTDGSGHYALAFRGTQPTQAQDWLNNALQGAGRHSQAYGDAETLGADVARHVGATNLAMVGHSLGGGLADAASLRAGTSAVTFNAAGLSDATMVEAGRDPGAARAAMAQSSRNYTVNGEILTTLQHDVPFLPAAAGHDIRLADPDPSGHPARSPVHDPRALAGAIAGAVQHSVWLHGMDSVREALDEGAPWLH